MVSGLSGLYIGLNYGTTTLGMESPDPHGTAADRTSPSSLGHIHKVYTPWPSLPTKQESALISERHVRVPRFMLQINWH
jgi:hypothetical protein